MRILKLKLNFDQLEFAYRVKRSLEMQHALTDKLLGLDSGKSTAKEVEAILNMLKQSKKEKG